MNIKSIRNKVAKAIEQADYSVEILRDIRVDDGMGSSFLYEEGVKQFDLQCVVDNSSSHGNRVTEAPQYSNAHYNTSTMLVCLYDDTKPLARGDYFIVDNKRYVIEQIDDVMHLHIFLQCSLKVIDNGE